MTLPMHKTIEIGRTLERSDEARRLHVPIVGRHATPGALLAGVGSLLLCLGGLIAMIGMQWIPIGDVQIPVGPGTTTLAGLILALPGAFLLMRGVRDRRARVRSQDLHARLPDQAWAWDGRWEGRILLDRNAHALRSGLLLLPFLICFAGIFHYAGFVTDRAPTLFRYASIFIDLGLGITILFHARSLARILKHGRGRIELAHMPIRPGKPCEVQFTLGTDLSLFDEIHSDLAYVEERIVESGGGNHRSRHLVAETRFSEHIELALDELTTGMQRSLALEIHLPADAPPTQISATPASSWQLAIHLKTLGLDYKGRFLLPVYRMSPAAQAPAEASRPVPALTTST